MNRTIYASLRGTIAIAALNFLATLSAVAAGSVDSAELLRQCLSGNGVGYSFYRDGQGPDYKVPIGPRTEQIAEDVNFLARLTGRLRIYSSTNHHDEIVRLAAKRGLKVMQGIYLGPDKVVNEQEIAAAVELAKQGLVDSLIVGNEVFTGGRLSKQQLIDYIRDVRVRVPKDVPVATAETWDKWFGNPDIVAEVDFVVAHFYPFWEEVGIDESVERLWANYGALTKKLSEVYPGKRIRIVIGETGWPSGGEPKGAAKPSPENQARYLKEFMASACARAVSFYYFSAFDEEWKWREGSSYENNMELIPRSRTFSGNWIGSSWGIFQASGRLKRGLAGIIDQPPVGTRVDREIYVDGQLAANYDLGVDTSERRRDWVGLASGVMNLAYPAGQKWGAVFLTVGKPSNPPRPWRDFSEYGRVSFEMRGESGGEVVYIGMKDFADPNSGEERKLLVTNIGREYSRYEYPLRDFGSSQFKFPESLEKINVVLEFLFDGAKAQTVRVKNIKFLGDR